jgi:hypothetical protein
MECQCTLSATLSNCGETLKLGVLSGHGNMVVAGVVTQGRVTTTKMEQWAIRSQVLTRGDPLHGCSSQTKWQWAGYLLRKREEKKWPTDFQRGSVGLGNHVLLLSESFFPSVAWLKI